jgi:hypothetical protein
MWQNGETQTIRVPIALKDDLVTLGQQLDQGRGVIAGKVRMQLETVLAHWQAESSLHPEEGWQPVRKLLGELEAILAEPSCQGRGRQGMGAEQHRHRHQHQNQHPCLSTEFSGATPESMSDPEPAVEVSVS